VRIAEDDVTDPRIVELLRVHVERMREHSPPGSVFALDVDGLRQPEVTMWAVWDDGNLMGCGALKELDPTHGELKSMRTADAYLRRGVAAALVDHIVGVARARGYGRVSLETGSGDAFDGAHELYRRAGFVECGAFGSYEDRAFSRFFTLQF
jgi:putative acetyltransferase